MPRSRSSSSGDTGSPRFSSVGDVPLLLDGHADLQAVGETERDR